MTIFVGMKSERKTYIYDNWQYAVQKFSVAHGIDLVKLWFAFAFI